MQSLLQLIFGGVRSDYFVFFLLACCAFFVSCSSASLTVLQMESVFLLSFFLSLNQMLLHFCDFSQMANWIQMFHSFHCVILLWLGCTWCVCKEMSDSVLQQTLDYACGAGADCGPVHQNGACFQPNTVRAHCNYAVNSYFQRKGQAQGTCDFKGTATVSASDPSKRFSNSLTY